MVDVFFTAGEFRCSRERSYKPAKPALELFHNHQICCQPRDTLRRPRTGKIMDKTFAEPEQAEDVPVKNEKIMDDTSDEEVERMEVEGRVRFIPICPCPFTLVSCFARPRSSTPEPVYLLASRCEVMSPPIVREWCTFVNDTKYTVMITDKDGTRPLKPGKSTTNVGIPGFKVILVLKLPNKDAQIEFPLSGFSNSTQKISQIYENEINQN